MGRTDDISGAVDVREAFRQNLNNLVRGERSISGLCREIGINRVQFNRYLNGEATPRIDVLHRICAHYDVGIEEVLGLDRRKPNSAQADAFAEMASWLFSGVLESPKPPYMKGGIYEIWRKSFKFNNLFFRDLIQINFEKSIPMIKFGDMGFARKNRKSIYELPMFIQREYGILLAVESGFVFLLGCPGQDEFGFGYVTRPRPPYERVFKGYEAFGRRARPDQTVFSNIIVIAIEQSTKSILASARKAGYYAEKDLPDEIRRDLVGETND